MARFSERYGYVTPSKVIIREEITDEIENANHIKSRFTAAY